VVAGVGQLHDVAGLDRTVEEQDQAADQVRDRLLQPEADADAEGAGEEGEGGEVDAGARQRDDEGEGDQREAEQLRGQHPQRRREARRPLDPCL
jgi:hypothetical protein